ncbi:hypothetical protein [Salipiger sp. PrR003]|uniref:hypothetical protein n=1 Tax=Salipiger sp. PrR003 TaxID=2706776 RepID=UPI0013DB4ECD|nr:hypothetical protein [Salipiger sp. PrR003]NDV52922.1 hypothetical protein [Salipiger sp. PrR003]
MKHRSQKGNALVQTAVCLVLAGLVAAGVMMAMSHANEVRRANTVIEDITLIRNGIERLNALKPDYSAVDDDFILNQLNLPERMVGSGTEVRSPYDRYKALRAHIGCAGCNNGYYVAAMKIPSDQCLRIARSPIGRVADRIRVMNDVGTEVIDDIAGKLPPIDRVNAVCQNGMGIQGITFYFKKQ